MEIKNVEARKTLMIRLIADAADLPSIMGETFGELAAYMERKNIGFAGMPYARYYNMDMNALDVEMGFPVSADDNGEGRISTGELPAGRIAATVHKGPYDKLEESYVKLMAFVKERGEEPFEWMYEIYLNSPMEVKAEDLETEICFPLK